MRTFLGFVDKFYTVIYNWSIDILAITIGFSLTVLYPIYCFLKYYHSLWKIQKIFGLSIKVSLLFVQSCCYFKSMNLAKFCIPLTGLFIYLSNFTVFKKLPTFPFTFLHILRLLSEILLLSNLFSSQGTSIGNSISDSRYASCSHNQRVQLKPTLFLLWFFHIMSFSFLL